MLKTSISEAKISLSECVTLNFTTERYLSREAPRSTLVCFDFHVITICNEKHIILFFHLDGRKLYLKV